MTSSTARWPSLLTVEQAAAMIGRNDQTVRLMIRDGRLRARKVGGGKGTFVLRRDQVLIDSRRARREREGRGRLTGIRVVHEPGASLLAPGSA